MTDENKNEEYTLISKVNENISTDIISDLKIGIYNLFISLFNNLIVHHGYEKAIMIATEYLDNISNSFKNILNENQENNNA